MKVQCDVCKGGEGAAVFCCADDAALCGACDARVHRANKLAGKHRRFSLHPASSPSRFPICDICREKRALLFCQEDRAILCGDCDGRIHDANDLTRKHSRFLLTGITLSPSSAAAPEPTSSSDSRPSSLPASSSTTATSADGEDSRPGVVYNISQSHRRGACCAPKQHERPAATSKLQMTDKNAKETASIATGFGQGKLVADKGVCSSTSSGANAGGGGISSISEYLMKELPGWHVEDLLLESCPPLHPATFVESLTPFWEADLDDAAAAAAAGAAFPACCVPRVPQFSAALPAPPLVHNQHQRHQQQQQQGASMTSGWADELAELPMRQLHDQYQHLHHRWTPDDGFTVPDLLAVHHNAPSYKRSRPSSWGV